MFPTSTAVPSTFEAYMAEHNVPADHPNLDAWQVLYERESIVEAAAPKTIPPCPSWCHMPAGHDYESTDGFTPGKIVFIRNHVAEHETPSTQISALEENLNDAVTVRPAGTFVTVSEDDYDAPGLRQLAAELLAAADVLDGLPQ